MKAGPELDALVAEKVMGWQRFPYVMPDSEHGTRYEWCPPGLVHVSTIEPVPPYSTDIAAAWAVVERMEAKGAPLTLVRVRGLWRHIEGEWAWEATFRDDTPRGSWNYAPTAPLAICRAALRAVGAEVPQ